MFTSRIRRQEGPGLGSRTRSKPALEPLEAILLLSGTPPVVTLPGGGGTTGGTAMVKDILPGSAGSYPTSLVNAGGTLFFLSVDQGKTNDSLWTSDGTAAGTVDLTPNLEASLPIPIGNSVVFNAFNLKTNAFGLWTSNGTPTGAYQITTLPRSSSDLGVSAGSVAYFDIFNNVSGQFELWKSDGTLNGTSRLGNIPEPTAFVSAGSKVFFTALDPNAGDEVWVSDGTTSGTHLLADINPGPGGSYPSELTAVGGTLFFKAFPTGSGAASLWESDGTTTGTQQVATNVPLQPVDLANVGGKLLFTAEDSSGKNPSVWTSDGTPGGTSLVANLPAGSPFMMASVGTKAFFGLQRTGTPGLQLWTSDGTGPGTVPVATVNDAAQMTGSGGRLYFTVDNSASGNELWSSDGTATGTALVADIDPGSVGSYPGYLTDVNGTLFFTADDGTHGNELWSTTPGSAPVPTTLNEGSAFSAAGSFSDSANDGPWSATVNYGDGSGSQPLALSANNTFNLSHEYLDNGNYVLTVSVTGADGLTGSNSLALTVNNVPPTAGIAGAPPSVGEGTLVSLTAADTDPSPIDTAMGFINTWNVTKNGSAFATGSGSNFAFTPDDNGTYVVTLAAQDKDGGVGTTSVTIAVTNVPPSPSIVGAPNSIGEGTPVTLSATVTDPSSVDTAFGFTDTWSVTQNGSPYASGSGSSFGFTPDDNGTYVVTLAAEDKDGGVGTTSVTIAVTNVPPTAAIAGNSTGVRGQTLGFVVSATDPSTVDNAAGFTYLVNWGDGSAAQAVLPGQSPSLSHVFTAIGTYTVAVTATDKDGGTSAVATDVVTVSAVALEPDPGDPSKTALVVGGTPGNDTIVFTPGSHGPGINVHFDGTSLGTFAPTGRIIAFGLAGNDDIEVAGSITLPALLDGGAGNDILVGGGGNDILIGGGGNDILIAGNGQSVMIGGGGSDLLVGSSGDDLMISGSTAYDANDVALIAILNEWDRALPVAQRVADLTQGLGDDVALNTSTVFDDGTSNLLLSGSGQNWLLVDSALDLLVLGGSTDVVTYVNQASAAVRWDAATVLHKRRH